jgi:hypothetical protein
MARPPLLVTGIALLLAIRFAFCVIQLLVF